MNQKATSAGFPATVLEREPALTRSGQPLADERQDHRRGALIVNADDWGQEAGRTDRIVDCLARKTVSSVSAMVFMVDSERSACIARNDGVDVGLHLNLTTPFSATNCPTQLVEYQRKVAAYLENPLARGVFNPLLARFFEYLVAAQRDEFHRLYGIDPNRYDGHHHMHLSANVLIADLLPSGTLVRRHFSYEPGERVIRNSVFRMVTNMLLSRRYRTVDYVFPLPPLASSDRLQKIFSLARQFVIEVETHPVCAEEYRFLTRGEIDRWAGDYPIASRHVV
jgi:predicted glycoside hydrolase/deacetylase ChbG (UPF0249 family)